MMALDAFGYGVHRMPPEAGRSTASAQGLSADEGNSRCSPKSEVQPGDYARDRRAGCCLRDRNGIHMVHVLDFSHLTEEGGSTRILFGNHSVVVPTAFRTSKPGWTANIFVSTGVTIVNLNKVTHYTTLAHRALCSRPARWHSCRIGPERSGYFRPVSNSNLIFTSAEGGLKGGMKQLILSLLLLLPCLLPLRRTPDAGFGSGEGVDEECFASLSKTTARR